MRTWVFPERHPTTPGPWTEEPDKAQWVDDTTGLDCLIVRNPMGALCGYVGVPPGHPWHGQDYDDVHASVHGGLTFSNSCQEGAEDGPGVCHIPEPGRPADVWWLGFDCGHGGDYWPALAAAGLVPPLWDGTYRTFDYVRAEVTRLAAQADQAK